jgi:hypothetical protein
LAWPSRWSSKCLPKSVSCEIRVELSKQSLRLGSRPNVEEKLFWLLLLLVF